MCSISIFSPTVVPAGPAVTDEKFCLSKEVLYIHPFGYGAGGLSLGYQFDVLYQFQLPVLLSTASDIHEANFQLLLSLCRSHSLLEMLRRTFSSRLANPISRTFVGYSQEPIGMGSFFCQGLIGFHQSM